MDTKSELYQKLEQKVITKQREYIDEYLIKKDVPYYKGESSYDDSQRMLVTEEIKAKDIPLQTRILMNVLYNVRQKNPSKVTSITDDNQFPAYQFLIKLQEPSNKYFTDGYSGFSVVEHLAMKYDDSFPDEKNGFDEIICYEGADLYRCSKRQGVENLQQAFLCRGLPQPKYKGYDWTSVSMAMTKNRYEYLTELAQSFDKDPESVEVINFVISLPDLNNSHYLHLNCDDSKEFEILRSKFIPGYKVMEPF